MDASAKVLVCCARRQGFGPAGARGQGLIAGAQAVEHYEISRYGTLKCWAGELGYKDVEFYIWAGVFAQSALPAPIVNPSGPSGRSVAPWCRSCQSLA